MKEKIISFWEFFKRKFEFVLNDTRGCVENDEYLINGVRYQVSTQFSKTETKTMKDKISVFIGSDFAHLINTDNIVTKNTEYANSTAGEGRMNVVK